MNSQILKLAKLLSMDHVAVMEEMEACAADTEEYCKAHQQEYEILDCLGGVITKEDYGCIQWIILAECLVKHNMAALLDWKCELEDFAYFVKGLAGKRKYKLMFRTAWFDEDESVEEWCAVLNAKWRSSGACLVQLDMDSDSCILVPVLSDQYESARRLADGIGQRLVLAGVEKPESTSEVLHHFMQRHPYKPSANKSPASVSCANCFMDSEIVYPGVPCNCDERKLFQIIIKARKLTPRQIMTASKHLRMGTMEVRQRLTLGKDVYVKAYLKDTLLAMEALGKELITYEVLPETPQYPHFHECTKKILRNDGNDYKYFLFDREREQEWSHNAIRK